MELISSPQNPKIKYLNLLQQKSSERRKSGIFVVEGRRELQHCLDAGFSLDTVFVCPEIINSEDKADRGSDLFSLNELESLENDGVHVYEISRPVYEKVAYRNSTEGVIAEVRQKDNSLNTLTLPANPLVVVLESVEKPGNLGAILRSADAAGVDAVIVCDPLTDLYNPNLIRSSLGGVFTVKTATCTSEECISYLTNNNIKILTAQLQDSKLYYETDMVSSTAIIMGTESTGLTNQWREAADAHIRIPMLGRLDSLNVSVSAAILMFEAVRQRSSEHECGA